MTISGHGFTCDDRDSYNEGRRKARFRSRIELDGRTRLLIRHSTNTARTLSLTGRGFFYDLAPGRGNVATIDRHDGAGGLFGQRQIEERLCNVIRGYFTAQKIPAHVIHLGKPPCG